MVKYLVIAISGRFLIQLLLRPHWSVLLGLAPHFSDRERNRSFRSRRRHALRAGLYEVVRLAKVYFPLEARKKRAGHLKMVWNRDREKQVLRKEIDNLLDNSGRDGIDSLSAKEHERFNKLSEQLEDLESKE